MTKKSEAARTESIERLKEWGVKPGDTIYTILSLADTNPTRAHRGAPNHAVTRPKPCCESVTGQNTRREGTMPTQTTNNRKIEIFVNGKYAATTTWSRTCKGAKDAYLTAHPEVKRASVSASFKPGK